MPLTTAHIFLSFITLAILATAVVQALLLYGQHVQLKHKNFSQLVRILPPLESMETLLFTLIRLGWLLLSITILTGFWLYEDLFAPPLLEKTLLTLTAWLVFSSLLGGRHWLGWRGLTAVRFTLWGYGFLIAGVIASQLLFS